MTTLYSRDYAALVIYIPLAPLLFIFLQAIVGGTALVGCYVYLRGVVLRVQASSGEEINRGALFCFSFTMKPNEQPWFFDSNVKEEMNREGVGPGVEVWLAKDAGPAKVLHVFMAFVHCVLNSVVQRVTAMNGARLVLRPACWSDNCKKIIDSKFFA